MLDQRPLSPEIRDMLLDNEQFQYAHLIKFERPSRPDSNSGQVSTSKQRYTYITDASRDVKFDDGSIDLSGAANGVQNYVANKVLKVSSVQEDTEAKASSYSLVLDGNGLGAVLSVDNAVINQIDTSTWDVVFPVNTDVGQYGFREGDKVNLTGAETATLNIQKFRAQNVVRVGKIDDNLAPGGGALTMSLCSDEIVSILQDKNSDSYASFVNREVYIYRAYFQNGKTVGTPFLLFKGIIAGVGFEDGDTSLTVTWNLTSHWGDFSQVKGRITSDDFHRALDQNGIPQPQSALKVAYAYDKGFMHAETSINILAQYSVQVEKQDVQVKSGFLGIGSKVKVKKYYETEIENTTLDFQLQAKSIPVIYGVQITDGIPVFADTLNSDSSQVYVIQALSEGEIGGVLNAYIDDNSLICTSKSDYDTRSVQTPDNTVQLVCRGRADRGDVLGGQSSISPVTKPFYNTFYSSPLIPYKMSQYDDFNLLNDYNEYIEPSVTVADTTGGGVTDGESMHLDSPQDITLDVFSGKPGQKAASSLVTIAAANNFKIQKSYWNGIDTADYWGPNHRLLDTAYVVGKYVIKEGETTIPSVSFVVRGKTIDCYNYDKSYNHYQRATTESSDNFLLGDYVDLQTMSGTTMLSSVQIVDKWIIRNTDGTANVRFRFSVDPPLQYSNGVPAITQFKMVKGGNTWTMITYNFVESSGTNNKEWLAQITGASNQGGYVQFNFAGGADYTIGGDPDETSSAFSVVDANGAQIDTMFFSNAVMIGTVTSNSLLTKYAWSAAGPAATSVVGMFLVRRNIISIPNGDSTNGHYDGFQVTLKRLDSNTGKLSTQTKDIIDYTNGIATIDGLWDYGYHPKVGDTVELTPAYADSRISINPAIQLMDYVTSTTYGRGLDYQRDLNFQSWLDTARLCDEQSDVTVQCEDAVTVYGGDIYRYPATGPILWQGTVLGSENDYIEFTNVLGKLTYAWNGWRTFNVGEIMYSGSQLYQIVTKGAIPNNPNGGLATGASMINSIVLTKVGGGGPNTISLMTDGNPVRALKNGTPIPGYSLYDADGVDYWRYIGWEDFAQRYATRHQTNLIVDTSLPLMDNVNSFLEHFGGILRYSGGQYYLDLEEPQGPISNESSEPRNITADHIIGKLRLTDEGIKSAYNSLTAAYADPANKFESRNISFFNSDYLKADKNVPKKGNLTVPGITNYYNTRLLADRTLNESRYGLQVSFNMAPRGTLLLAGQVVQLQYPRYGWESKKFRISTLTHQEDATVDIVADEYDDSFYGLSNISKQAASGIAGENGSVTGIGAPSNLRATSVDNGDETNSAVAVTWDNNPAANTKNVSTELYSSYSSHLYVDIASIQGNVLTTNENPHQLQVGEQITSQSTISGLAANQSYFIVATPTANSFQISETKDGPLVGLTDNPNVDALMMTASLIATVAIPANSYVDVFGGIDSRVVKYYWVRHKVVQGT